MPVETVTLPTEYQALGVALQKALHAQSSSVNANAGVNVHFEDGRGFFIHSLWNDKSRFTISCLWPKTRTGRNEHPSTYETQGRTTSITVAKTRTPEQIAREITRRLLPDYNELFAVVKARILAENAYDDAVAANVKRVSSAAQVPLAEGKQTSVSLYHSTHPLLKGSLCDVRVSSDKAEFMNLSVTLPRAECILKLLMTPLDALQEADNDEIPTDQGWYRIVCQNPWGDEVIPVRAYWIGRDLMVDLPQAGGRPRTRRVNAVGGWKGKVRL